MVTHTHTNTENTRAYCGCGEMAYINTSSKHQSTGIHTHTVIKLLLK